MNNPFEILNDRLKRIEDAQGEIQLFLNQLITLKSTTSPVEDRWMNLNELCEYHPDKPSKATVYLWVRESTIPYHKTTGQKRIRFLKSEIDAWIITGRKKTRAERQVNAADHSATLTTK